MKKTFNYFLFILPAIFLLFSSCGKEVNSNTTDVVFSTGALVGANLDTAVIVAVNVYNGTKMTFYTSTTSPAVMSVPNGLWRFYGYGWETTNHATGVMRCAYGGSMGPTVALADDIYLTGGGTSVYMEFTTSNCDFPSGNNVFHNGSAITGSTKFLPLTIYLCGENPGSTPGCTSYPRSGGWGQLRLAGFTNYFGGLMIKEELTFKSVCTPLIAGAWSTGYAIPPGNENTSDFPFAFVIETYNNSGCTGAPINQKQIDKGIAKTAVVNTTVFKLYNDSINLNIMLNVNAP